MTTTLFNIIRSELIKKGCAEIVDKNGELVFFNEDVQFTKKILSYDQDVSEVVDKLFSGTTLNDPGHDQHFKKTFLLRFVNRRINRQTVEAFQMELLSTFLTNEDFVNRVYADAEKYVTQTSTTDQQNKQQNKQSTDGSTVSDNRQAFSELPQNSVNLDVDDTVMESANDNTISRNKQVNRQNTGGTTSGESSGENRSYSLDELMKSSGLMEELFNIFERKCFMLTW